MHAPSRLFRVCLLLFVLTSITGCGATERIDGEIAVYRPTTSTLLVMLVGGLALTGIGGWWVKSERDEYQRLVRRAKKRGESTDDISTGSGKSWGVLLGGALILIGGVPGQFLSQVTVTPEHAVVNDSVFWFSPNQATIPLANVTAISTSTEERWSRRGKSKTEYLVFEMNNGAPQKVKSGVLIRAALPRIVARIEKTNEQPPPEALAANPAPIEPAASDTGFPLSPPGPNPHAGLDPLASPLPTPVGANAPNSPAAPNTPPNEAGSFGGIQKHKIPPPGFDIPEGREIVPGEQVLAEVDGSWRSVRVQRVLENGDLEVALMGLRDEVKTMAKSSIRLLHLQAFPSTPPGRPVASTPAASGASSTSPATGSTGQPVTAESELGPGTKLEAEWARRWLPVEVLAVEAGGKVRIHWVGYSNSFDESVPRSRLRFPPEK